VPNNKFSGSLPDAWAADNAFPDLQKMYVANNTLTGA
jgi:hypothetical protein